jgi:cyclic pyranopterin monophosphate synthase
MAELSHVDSRGHARMVDVGKKADTERNAVARGKVNMRPETLSLITSGNAPKGDVFAVARIAAIMAAKKTSEIIPLCHPLPLTSVTVDLEPGSDGCSIDIGVCASCTGKTGVEMEALTAVSIAALTIYDMCKAVDRSMTICDVRLVHKDGGKSGVFSREDETR